MENQAQKLHKEFSSQNCKLIIMTDQVKALFLDRDGVINKEKNYLYKIQDFEFIDGAFDSCRFFQSKGFKIVVVTNQSGIARGIYSEEDYQKLTLWMISQFQKENITILGVYYCPHHPEYGEDCNCRKPKPGQLLKAAVDNKIDLSQSIMVGDKASDMEAAEAAGIPQRVIVQSGHAVRIEDEHSSTHEIESIKYLPELFYDVM